MTILEQMDAAIVFLREEIKQIQAGEKDECFEDIIMSPLPREKFEEVLKLCTLPTPPTILAEMATELRQAQAREKQQETDHRTAMDAAEALILVQGMGDVMNHTTTSALATGSDNKLEGAQPSTFPFEPSQAQTGTIQSVSTTDQHAHNALANLRSLRKTMMLDVLSKIVSVAKSKNVDPAMCKNSGTNIVDLEMIQTQVSQGQLTEWAMFAEYVYHFCEFVITYQSEQGNMEAKQKGVELLHFSKTLTETLRKASVKKEETLMQQVGHHTTSPKSTTTLETTNSTRPILSMNSLVLPPSSSPNSTTQTGISPPPPTPSTDAMTPSRTSARIRQRENSVTDSPSPQRRGSRATEILESADHSLRKRPRGVSGASSAASSPHGGVNPNGMEDAEADGGRVRKRRPVLQATRVSSRQSKRRAAAAARAAAGADDDEDERDDEGVEEEEEAGSASDGITTAQDLSDKSLALTKSGRPRKRPGRKPKNWVESNEE